MSLDVWVPDGARRRRRKNLERLLRPRHIAFVGGSQVAGGLAACRRAGFAGDLWAVNPTRKEIGGLPCVPRIEDLPAPPDAALLALSPDRTLQAAQALGAIGAGGAVCLSAGFAELGGQGAALQSALRETAGDLALLGPNCMGLLNQFDGAAVWGSENHVERVVGPAAAIISQSGAFLFGMTNVEQAFPLGYAVSTGNQAVTDMADCLEAVLEDERVRAVGIYLEGLEDGNALGAACWRALEMAIPVVALKGGDTPAGKAVAQSHTGAMVVEADMWRAFVERYGTVEVSSPKGMVEALKLLAVGGVPRGPRFSAVTFSGGLNGLIAARAPSLGLVLAPPTAENACRLRNKLPETVPVANPLDLNLPWRSKTGMTLTDGDAVAESIIDFAKDAADMVALILDVPRPDENNLDADWLPSIESMTQVRAALGIPCAVAAILPEGLDVALRRRLLADGIVPLLGFNDAMEAFSAAARVAGAHAAMKGKAVPPALLCSADAVPGRARMLDEAASKALLRAAGLTTPDGWSGPRDGAAAAAAKLGFPVAVKVLSDKIAHKARVGGLRLGLTSAAAVEGALEEIIEAVSAAGVGARAERFLVERMIDDPMAELIVGVKRHPALGFVLMIGRGGTAVESIRSYTTLLLPLQAPAVEAALAAAGLSPESTGYKAVCDTVHGVAAFAEENREGLVTLEVNPVIVTGGGDAVAADALVMMN